MLEQKTLESIIRERVTLGNISPTGFYNLRCPCCNDHSERGGFKFDGDTTGYSCWNCQARFRVEEGTGKISKSAKDILECFGITREDLRELTSSIFLKPPEEKSISLESVTRVKLHTPEVAFPDRTRPLLSEGHDELQAPILEYLIGRGIDPLQHNFYFSLDPKMLRRVIIPFWRGGKLIYWQARSIDKGVKPRYRNCEVSKDAVLYGYDQLHTYEAAPLFCTEGVFDALMINGVCTLGASLTVAKIEILKRTKRRLIFVIDRDQTGGELGKTVLANGWEITFVDIRADDINDSVVKFGLPYTAYSLVKNATTKTNMLQSSISLNMGLMEARLRRK
ncbi:hypothetical protein [Acinetobacter sp.]|uniref:hypothetical protein n=1 Tax=Acinetobacter sp. TaxID=472 RepID=UPI00388F5248